MQRIGLALVLLIGPSCGTGSTSREQQEALLQRRDAMSQRLDQLEKEVEAREAELAAAQAREPEVARPEVSLAHPLPATQAQQPAPSVQLTLRATGLLVDGVPMTREQATDRFRELARTAPDTRVSLLAEPEVPYAEMIEVLDLANEAGLSQIAISARVHGEGEAEATPATAR